MLVDPGICDKCKRHHEVEYLRCDECGRQYDVDDFPGTVVHFTEPDCQKDCDNCDVEEEEEDKDDIIYKAEFHFCNRRCLQGYLMDPNADGFSKFEGRGIIMIVGPEDADWLIDALGRCDYDG